jgi:uncharacterized alkaline shock family protein YloU/adenylate kinase family enzyme
MKTYALIGPSGSGKSHQSVMLAYREEIECIIDDGLLIRGNQALAGRSAKRERNMMSATKRAIFYDPEHAAQVREKIKETNPQKILILGISEQMLKKITAHLEIPYPEKIFRIEEISNPQEIAKALETRTKHNCHVIPLPAYVIEKDFPGYFLASIKAFLKSRSAPSHTLEHSVVRPLYSSLGNYYLSENAVEQMAIYAAEQVEGIVRGKKTKITSTHDGMLINMDVTVKYGVNLPELLQNVQIKVKNELERLTGFEISALNITAKSIVLEKEELKTKGKYIELHRKKRNN